MLTRAMALELAASNVHVNAIAPGTIRTALGGWYETDEAEHYLQERVPWRRFGSPDDVVGAAVFLASDESAYMTGASILVDGGLMAGVSAGRTSFRAVLDRRGGGHAGRVSAADEIFTRVALGTSVVLVFGAAFFVLPVFWRSATVPNLMDVYSRVRHRPSAARRPVRDGVGGWIGVLWAGAGCIWAWRWASPS